MGERSESTPITLVACSIVAVRDACTLAKLPPMPFTMGLNTTKPGKSPTTLSSTMPPSL